jgi:hypothetical protein
MTRPTLRWVVAVLVTIIAFAAATWICGAFVLTMLDPGVRWGVAGSLGVAVAALAALWGHSYAAAEQREPTADAADVPTGDTGRTGNKISGGIFHGLVIQGRDIGSLNLSAPVTEERTQDPPPAVGDPPAEG